MQKTPYNNEWFYKGMLPKRKERNMVITAAALLGLQLALFVVLLLV